MAAAPSKVPLPPVRAALSTALAGVAIAPFSLGTMFLLFVKIGAVLFGSGYVLIAFLQADFVDRLHWLTRGQLLDAVAVGTPLGSDQYLPDDRQQFCHRYHGAIQRRDEGRRCHLGSRDRQ